MPQSNAMTDGRSAVTVEDRRCTCCAQDVLDAVRGLEGVRLLCASGELVSRSFTCRRPAARA